MKGFPNPLGRDRFVLDTSAILTLRADEDGADQVEAIIRDAATGNKLVYASFMTYMETYYRVFQLEGEEFAKRTYAELKSLPIEQILQDEIVLLQAGNLKATYRLSVADAWIIASALRVQATLVHKDPEFEQVAHLVPLLTLPYKKEGH